MKTNQVIEMTMDKCLESIGAESILKLLMYQSLVSCKESESVTYTYVIKDKVSNLSKIGKTVDLNKRLSMLSAGNPNLSLEYVFYGDIENLMHKTFSAKRVKGEWFLLSEEDFSMLVNNYGFEKA